MTKELRLRLILVLTVFALVLALAVPAALARNPVEDRMEDSPHRNQRFEDHDDDDEEEIEFAETAIFFEFNSTDRDLGIQIFFDAEGWKEVEVKGPDGSIFEVENGGGLKDIGSTEVFTESAEPELCPEEEEECDLQAAIEEFLMQFPEGEYEFEGETVEGQELVGSAELSWDLPEAVELIDPAENFPTIEWSAPSEESAEIVGYQAVAELVIEDDEGEEVVYVQSTDLPAGVFSVETSPQFAALVEQFGDAVVELKVELIAIGANGNKTITEEPVIEPDEE